MKKEDILTIGTIVKVKKSNKKIMIISRGALYNDKGVLGYFEYSGCHYPEGQNSTTVLYFNNIDIEEVIFKGFNDEEEDAFLDNYLEVIEKTKYPKMLLDKGQEKKRRL